MLKMAHNSSNFGRSNNGKMGFTTLEFVNFGLIGEREKATDVDEHITTITKIILR
jgi:hypothetical protein